VQRPGSSAKVEFSDIISKFGKRKARKMLY